MWFESLRIILECSWELEWKFIKLNFLQTAVIMERKKREQLRKSLGKLQEEMKQQVCGYYLISAST